MKKLQNEDVQQRTLHSVSEKLDKVDPSDMSVEKAWDTFKSALLNTLQETCGTKKTGSKNRKATAWWTEEVKEAVAEKKRLFQAWLNSQKEEDYAQYKITRSNSKVLV